MRFLFVCAAILALNFSLTAQKLQPGFNPKEYIALLSMAYYSKGVPPERILEKDLYHLEYRSEEIGLANRWTLYLRDDNVGVVDVRGTVSKTASWMANFYAGMIPATGSIQLTDSITFNYQLAEDPKAMVHVGWTVALGFLAPGIEKKINEYYRDKNVKEFILSGHSQGAAITFLLRSWLEYEKKKGNIPNDIVFKTYCSAAPKPGNMYYAYDFDYITRNGWGFRVVNTADWVPETPFSIQRVTDINPTNPFIYTKTILKKQKLLLRIAGNMLYNKLTRATRKAQKKFEKYMGRVVYKQVRKILPELKQPEYAHSFNYTPAGVPVILKPDEAYRQAYPESNKNFFIHHSYNAYYSLVKKYYL